jgi:hypothetical protein
MHIAYRSYKKRLSSLKIGAQLLTWKEEPLS